ncbi:alkaline phosphatase family protein [Micromonospora humi]|uniref:Type I phosphodiesterase / nucleotide pyrophosphatase n=1 Tax=Micromonospora humi TaxID=745366 RepID=A0A1C5JP50_9ACTN|nr:alkaline phosphatase family protein [Micromonospora humi]SCG72365.1 Type I phosphodiesterase / nucleotide pyrophosphatase [Micromonospora humi]
MTVYWVVWDAGARWLVDGLDARGRLPNVRRLQAAGVRAAARPARPNCQTPPSLATLFTGTPAHVHGVTGFRVPDRRRFGASRSGFDPAVCAVPPIWRRLGVRSAFVHVPWVFDPDGQVGAYVDAAVEAFSGRLARHAVLRPSPGGVPLVDALPEAAMVTAAPGGTVVTGPSGAVRVTDSWVEVDLGGGLGCHVRLVSRPDGGVLLRTGVWRTRCAGGDPALVRLLRGLPAFAGESAGSVYRSGDLGVRLPEGGDGAAEELLLSSLEPAARTFAVAADVVLDRHRADLVVVYLPMTDDIGHELAGWVDASGPGYRPELAGPGWNLLARAYRTADAILGRVLDRAGPDDTVLLTADHGIAGTTHDVYPNAALAAAGLATPDGRGGVDPERSAVVFHAAGDGSLWVNPRVRAQDPARPWLRAAVDVLAATAGPAGQPVLVGLADGRGDPVGEPAGRDHVYCRFAAGLMAQPRLPGNGTAYAPTRKSGGHLSSDGDPRLDAVYAAAGPGLPTGVDLGRIDNAEIAAVVEGALSAVHVRAGS